MPSDFIFNKIYLDAHLQVEVVLFTAQESVLIPTGLSREVQAGLLQTIFFRSKDLHFAYACF